MTPKEKILRLLEILPEDVTYEQVLYRISVIQSIDIGLEQAARGEVIDHDELFDDLLAEYEEAQNRLDGSSKEGIKGRSGVHRKAGTPGSSRVRKAPEKARRKA